MGEPVPGIRIRNLNEARVSGTSNYVVYWMTAFRRVRYNFALQHARDLALSYKKPLLILEPLRCGYRWACDRFHRFVIEGMIDNDVSCSDKNVTYYPYLEPQAGSASHLIETLSKQATAIVTDDFPCFFHPHMNRLAARRVACPLVAVDSNGLMPMSHADRTFTVAHSYRRWMQKELPEHLHGFPEATPLANSKLKGIPQLGEVPGEFLQRWPRSEIDGLLASTGLFHFPIDHGVAPGVLAGGSREAKRFLKRFIAQRLASYDGDRNEPDELGASELSPYLHFGHISAHEVFSDVMESEHWNLGKLSIPNGKVEGFWGVSKHLEAFLDQLCTWREIGFNMCFREPNYAQFKSLPTWAQETLGKHKNDPRPYVYSRQQLDASETHDEIWNAAQRQLVREGRIHNYMRMLWGKKILQWSPDPHTALRNMVELNNKYALDGRDPNSYSGIFWVLGRYDRAWGPERAIFGKIRYMTSENTAKKHRLSSYIRKYSADGE